MKLQKISFQLPKPQYIQDFAAARRGMPWYGELLLGIAGFVLFLFVGIFGGAVPVLFLKAIGIASSSLPSWVPEFINNFFAFGTGILLILLLARLFQKRGPHSFGFVRPKWGVEYLFGIVLGLITFTLVILLAVLTGTIAFSGLSSSFSLLGFVLLFVSYVVQGMAEEVVLRGFFLSSISRRNPLWLGVVAGALIFSLGHLNNSGGFSPFMILNVTLVGVCFGVAVLKRGGLWLACGFHAIWNFVQSCIFGLPVSGQLPALSIFSSGFTSETTLLTGGAFGLEASILCTLSLALLFLFLLALKPVDRSAER